MGVPEEEVVVKIYDTFHKTRTHNPKINNLTAEDPQNAKVILKETKKKAGGIMLFWLQTILQSYIYENSMVLKQKHA